MPSDNRSSGQDKLSRLQDEIKQVKEEYLREMETIKTFRHDQIPIGFTTETWKVGLQTFNERWPKWKTEQEKARLTTTASEPAEDLPDSLPIILKDVIANHI